MSYGNSVTKNLTLRLRAGILSDYKAVFGNVPATESDWQNLTKMYRGEKPTGLSAQSDLALQEFKKISQKVASLITPAEKSFVEMLAYRLRPAQRSLEKENQALSIFTKVYRALPSSAQGWSILRAIAYTLIK
jgi:hypothetical protein